jgi:xanthine dehydrogenase accessory factor
MNTSSAFYEQLAAAARGGEPAWLATVVTTTDSTPARVGMKMIARTTGLVAGTIGGGALEKMTLEKIRAEQPGTAVKWSFDLGSEEGVGIHTPMVCGGVEEILVEPLASGVPLIIFGGGHCGIALSQLAAQTGFAVTVYDCREEWASAEKHPHAARLLCAPYEGVENRVALTAQTYVVIMTHGHQHDASVLRQVVGADWKYLGMMGSGKKVGAVLEGLRVSGVDPARIGRVSSPIGVAIGSHTPEEIAVSIVAQMIAVRNGIDGALRSTNTVTG